MPVSTIPGSCLGSLLMDSHGGTCLPWVSVQNWQKRRMPWFLPTSPPWDIGEGKEPGRWCTMGAHSPVLAGGS